MTRVVCWNMGWKRESWRTLARMRDDVDVALLQEVCRVPHEVADDVDLGPHDDRDAWDPVTKNRYVFVTNNTTWVAQTIADIYKSRWQIELFFKWIKQHLKVKRFVGRSKNAVMTQLWVAMCMYLLLAYLKFVMRLRWSPHQMLQVLQLNMFERRPLQDLFTTPSLPAPSGSQLSLAWS